VVSAGSGTAVCAGGSGLVDIEAVARAVTEGLGAGSA
jgi:hypothetical protein